MPQTSWFTLISRRARRWAAAGAAVLLAACQTPPAPPQAPVPPPPETMPVLPPRPPRLGLALGGGAARGFAHIGVIQVLEEHGLKPDLVVGTSAGSLVATLYAAGRSPAELAALAGTMDETTIADWSFPLRGVLRGEALARFVNQHVGGRTIDRMRMPLGIVATDLGSGSPILFRRGDPGTAVRASSAVPAVFQPVRIGDREYVDGGLVAPVPVRFAREMGAEVVVAVDISAAPEGNTVLGDAVKLLLQTFAIMSRSLNQHELKEADVVIRPHLAGASGADFGAAARRRAIQAGREAALAALPALKQRMAARVPPGSPAGRVAHAR